MTKEFAPPDIDFKKFPLIGKWIEFEYSKINSFNDCVDFIHNCLNVAETTENAVKKECYQTIASYLYSVETNINYNSKHFELLILNN
jgi:hypothetical protein